MSWKQLTRMEGFLITVKIEIRKKIGSMKIGEYKLGWKIGFSKIKIRRSKHTYTLSANLQKKIKNRNNFHLTDFPNTAVETEDPKREKGFD